MNACGMLVAMLQLCAFTEACVRRDWRQAVTYLGFAIGSVAIAWRK